MRSSLFRVVLFTSVCVTSLSVSGSAKPFRTTQAETADQTLRLAGAYVLQYERAIQGLMVQEDYEQVVLPTRQSVPSAASRKLRSELLILGAGRFGWIAFRDVFEVDGRPVRDREERLSRLL